MLQSAWEFYGRAVSAGFRKEREPSEFRHIFQLKIEKSDLYLKMTALVKLLLLVAGFSFRIQTKCQNSDKVSDKVSDNVYFLLFQNNHVPQIQTFGFNFFF